MVAWNDWRMHSKQWRLITSDDYAHFLFFFFGFCVVESCTRFHTAVCPDRIIKMQWTDRAWLPNESIRWPLGSTEYSVSFLFVLGCAFFVFDHTRNRMEMKTREPKCNVSDCRRNGNQSFFECSFVYLRNRSDGTAIVCHALTIVDRVLWTVRLVTMIHRSCAWSLLCSAASLFSHFIVCLAAIRSWISIQLDLHSVSILSCCRCCWYTYDWPWMRLNFDTFFARGDVAIQGIVQSIYASPRLRSHGPLTMKYVWRICCFSYFWFWILDSQLESIGQFRQYQSTSVNGRWRVDAAQFARWEIRNSIICW